MKRLQAVLLLAALVAASPAAAQEATRSGVSIGARAAYAWPFGTAFDLPGPIGSVDFSDTVDYALPIWVDLTLRLGGGIEVGPYFQWAYTKFASGSSDNGSDWRVGGQLNYRLTPAGGFAPWLGVGAGWEWLRDGASIDGFDFMVQGGADWRVGTNLAIGPFVAVTFGRFSNGDLPAGADKTFHEWLQVGVKGSFDL